MPPEPADVVKRAPSPLADTAARHQHSGTGWCANTRIGGPNQRGSPAGRSIRVQGGAMEAYTRQQLHDLVWSGPMRDVAKKLGLSDNGLRKHCAKAFIPLPP
jgi:hypothetical protein